MNRVFAALATSLSLLALAGVAYLALSRQPSTSGGGIEDAALESLITRIGELESRLDEKDTTPFKRPSRAKSREDSRNTETTPEGMDEEPDDEIDEESDGTELAARVEALETRIRGLEEDPIQRAFTFLQSGSADLRKRGVLNLEELAKNDPEARAAIHEMLADEDAGVRITALDTLTDIRDEDVIPMAANLLGDENEKVRREAINTLTRLGAKDSAVDIAAFIDDENADIRRAAVDSMGKLGFAESKDALIGALADENHGVRGEAISSLGEIGAREALPKLQTLYTDVTGEGRNDSDHRFRLANAMKQLGDPSAARQEISKLGDKILTSESGRERGGALRALGWIGRGEAMTVEILEKAAQDSNEWVKREAKRMLEDHKRNK